MPAEHGSVQPSGLRREHLVAAAMVAAVTVVLGFASGFGVRDVGAAASPPVNPGTPAVTQPGGQPAAPPLAGPGPAGAARPSGSQVGLRPASAAAPGSGPGAGADLGSGLGGSDPGGFPMSPPASAAGPSVPPAGSVPSAPQCPPGVLDSLLALLTEVLGGSTPAQALSDGGITAAAPAQPGTTQAGTTQAGTGTIVPTLAADELLLLPVGEGTVAVAGLVPLLDTVAHRGVAYREAASQDNAAEAPAVGVAGDQLSQLAALLAPVGLSVDPGTGIVDPLLTPVLGSLGCGGITPATSPGAVP